MSAREEILARLRQQEREVTPPPVWTSRRQYDDLARQFAQALRANQGEVHRAADLEAALERLGDLLTELGATKVVANGDSPFGDLDLAAYWPDIEWHLVDHQAGRSSEDTRAFCAVADAGLSGADAALAETGSILISSGPGQSRLATLLPPVHLALVPTSRLTPDIFTWTATRQEAPPSNMILVSGPSKTGDIEQTLVIGVHGPKRFVVILYEE
jgi:L-lactate dehydrogenase complex protein LldG